MGKYKKNRVIYLIAWSDKELPAIIHKDGFNFDMIIKTLKNLYERDDNITIVIRIYNRKL